MKYLIATTLLIFIASSVSANRGEANKRVLSEDFECWEDTMNTHTSGSVVCFCRSLVNVTLTGWFTSKRVSKSTPVEHFDGTSLRSTLKEHAISDSTNMWDPITGWLNWEDNTTEIGLGWVSKNNITNTMIVAVGEWNFYQHTLDMRTITHTTGKCGFDSTLVGQSRYKMTNSYRSPCTYMTSTP